jgi:HEAT repeat protein
LSLDEIVKHAHFDRDYEKLIFQKAVRDAQSENSTLREAAARELKKTKNPAVVQVLMQLAEDPTEDVRVQSLDALVRQQDESVFPLFEKALKYDGSTRVRLAAVRGLYRLHELNRARTIPYLIQALEDKEAEVRRRAVASLSWAGVSEAVPNLIQLLDDPDVAVRKASIHALETLKSKLTVPWLIRALEDEDAQIRKCAYKALKNLTKQEIPFSKDGIKAKAKWKSWWKANKEKFQIT